MLIILQGVPGSGKSTLARLMKNARRVSTDDFMMIDGEYRWQPDQVPYYHAWNQFEADHWLACGRTVVVDNCNVLRAHAQPYFDLADKYQQRAVVIRCNGEFGNEHGVPLEVVEGMKERMEVL